MFSTSRIFEYQLMNGIQTNVSLIDKGADVDIATK